MKTENLKLKIFLSILVFGAFFLFSQKVIVPNLLTLENIGPETQLAQVVTSGNVYYASPSGSGSTCSPSSPCSYSTGVGKLASGDTLMLSAGTYNTSLNASSIPSGSSWNNTTKIIGAGANGGTRFVTPSGGRGIYAFSTISYIEFSDLEFDGSSGGDDGLKFDANNIAHIKFTRIRTHNYAGQGIAINSPSSETISDIQFFQVESHNNGYASDQCNNRPGYCHGMYVNARDMIIDGAKLHDNNGLGIQIYPGPTDNPIMRNSLIYNNYNWGLFVADTVTNGKIYNNTIYGNRNNYGLAYGRSDCQVRNNIVYNNDQSITTSCTQSNNLTSNPNFVNAGAGDFHLQSNSSAINAGYNVGSAVPTDKDGVSRPQGSAYDIGAYEYTGGTTNPAPTISLTASPTSITSGTASTLTWSSTNATSCTASGAWSGTKSTSGSQSTGNLTANSTFTLSCTGTGGTTNQSVTVNVTAPIAFNFTLSNGGNKSVTQGSSVTNSVTATLSSGTTQSTGFTVSGLPTGAIGSFSPTACSPTCSTTLTINTLSTTPTGNSTITVTATAGSVIKTSTFILTVNAPVTTSGNVYYVATNGNDSTSCTNARNSSTPKRTIASGIGCLSGGDTLIVKAGSYSESINAGSIPSGTSWSNTTKIIGAGAYGGTRLSITGDIAGIYGSGFSYMEFKNLEIDGNNNAGLDGIKFWGASHIRFTGVRTHHFANQGVLLTETATSNDIQFFQHEADHNGVNGGCYQARRCHGMYIQADNLLIDGANLHDNEALGIQIYPGPGVNPIMRNSVIYNNGTYGLFVSGGFSGGKIYNNTITGNGSQSDDYGLIYDADASNCQVRNNIVYNNSATIRTSCAQSNNLTSNPSFVNAGTNDFHLQSTSGAINTGATLSEVTTDMVGVSRPQGSAYDIGAYEYTGGTTNPVPTISLTASPTSITSGTASTLTWSSTNATSCTASGAWSGTKSTSGSQSTGNLTANSTFTLSCTGTGGTTNQSVTVNVTAPIAFNFTLSNGGNKSVTQGSSVTNSVTATLSSGTSQSTGFAVSGLPTGATASFSPTACSPTCSSTLTINTLSTTPTGNSTVTITATGGSVIKTSTFTLTVNAPTSTKFSINDRVQVNATFVNVRATANGTLLGTQTTNALGTVIGGPTNTGGYNWWNINFDTGFDGWSAEDYLVKYTILSPLDFTLSNGGNKSVTQGSSVTNSVTATLSSGTTQSTGFAVSGLPTGATASFSPTACSPNCSTTLTISTSASTPAGNSTIIVTVTAGSVTKTSTFTLTVNAPTTTSGALLQKSDLVYQGSFKVPHGTFGASSFDWGEGIMAYNPANNSLFISSHPYQNSVAEISIPTVVNSSSLAALNTASVLQNFSEISEGRKNQIPCIGTHFIGGLLPRGSSLLVSYYNFYDGGTCQQQSHFVSGQTLSTGGDVTGPWAANYAVTPSTNNAGYVHGWMIPVPSAYQSSLGGSAILGNCCLSIVGRTSQGPSVFSFNPSTVGANNPFPITPLLYYSPEHPSLGQWNQTSPTFNGTTQIKGAAMIDGTRSLLFFGRQGTGTYCYGPGAQCGDPVNANQGDHAYPYVSQIWAYDVNDLIASKNGQISPWNVMPYSVWTYTTPFQRANNGKPGGVAWDPNTRRLFVVEQFGDSDWPVITVWQVSGSGTTNPVPTVSLTASPTSITSGTASTLTWSSTNVTSCTASGAWSGTKSTSGSQSTGNLTANSTFTLSCTGTGGTTNQSVSVNVTAPIAFNFTLSNGGNKSVTQGSSVTNSVTATLSSGTTQSTGFTVSGLPSGATGSFSPTACSPTCSSTLTINTLSTTPTGNSTITVTATAGSVIKTSTFTLTVNAPADTTAPIISNVSASQITLSTTQISWTTNENADSRVEYGLSSTYTSLSPLNPALLTSHFQVLTSLLPSTTYHYRVKSKNAAGLEAVSGDLTFTTASPPDTTPPFQITNLASSNITSNSVTLTWSAPGDNQNTSSYEIRYGNTPITSQNFSSQTLLQNPPLPKAPGLSESITIGSLLPSSTYHFAIRSKDNAGNASVLSNIISITTLPASVIRDILPPSLSGIAHSSIATSSARIIWQTNEAADSKVILGKSAAQLDMQTLSSFFGQSHDLLFPGLKRKTTYFYRVVSKDLEGNTATSSVFSFKTATGTPPKILAVLARQGSVILSWQVPDDLFIRQVRIYRRTDQHPVASDDASLLATITDLTQTQYTDASAVDGTTYFYSIFAVDDENIFSDPAEISFTPQAPQTSQSSQSSRSSGGGASRSSASPSTVLIQTPAVQTITNITLTGPFGPGVSGAQVTLLQQTLVRDGVYPEATVTGYYGSATQSAVRRFQQKYGIEATGIAGPLTRAKLNELYSEVPTLTPVAEAQRQERIRQIKTLLAQLIEQLIVLLQAQLPRN